MVFETSGQNDAVVIFILHSAVREGFICQAQDSHLVQLISIKFRNGVVQIYVDDATQARVDVLVIIRLKTDSDVWVVALDFVNAGLPSKNILEDIVRKRMVSLRSKGLVVQVEHTVVLSLIKHLVQEIKIGLSGRIVVRGRNADDTVLWQVSDVLEMIIWDLEISFVKQGDDARLNTVESKVEDLVLAEYDFQIGSNLIDIHEGSMIADSVALCIDIEIETKLLIIPLVSESVVPHFKSVFIARGEFFFNQHSYLNQGYLRSRKIFIGEVLEQIWVLLLDYLRYPGILILSKSAVFNQGCPGLEVKEYCRGSWTKSLSFSHEMLESWSGIIAFESGVFDLELEGVVHIYGPLGHWEAD